LSKDKYKNEEIAAGLNQLQFFSDERRFIYDFLIFL